MPARTFTTILRPYPCRLRVKVYGPEDLMRAAGPHGPGTVAVTTASPKGVITVHIRRASTGGVRAHEAVHAAMFCLQHCGVDPVEGHSEALAYLTQHIYGHILQAQRATVRV